MPCDSDLRRAIDLATYADEARTLDQLIAIAGLGWSWLTALVAGVTAAGIVALVAPLSGTLLFLIAIGLPTAGFTYLASLNRDVIGPDGRTWTQWYPIGRVLAAITIWAGGLSAFALLAAGTDLDTIRDGLRATVDRFIDQSGQLPADVTTQMTAERRDQLTQLFLRLLPAATASVWTVIAVVNLWLGGRVAAGSGQLQRPWPDLSAIVLPRSFPIFFTVAAVLSFMDGIVGLMASCFVWAFTMAYLFQGLAILHQVTRGSDFRAIALVAVYLALMLFFPFSWLGVALLGVAEPISPLRRKVTEANMPPTPPPGQGPPSQGPPSQGPPSQGPPPSVGGSSDGT